MKLRLLVLVASAAWVGALLPSTMGARASASAAATRAASADEPVQIEEQIVRVDQTAPAIDSPGTEQAAPTVERERKSSKAPRRSVRRRSARDNDETSVASRARRLFFGDGAVRPEPFPKPR